MLMFWLLAAGLLVIAIFPLIPILSGRKRKHALTGSDDANVAVYQQRFAELQTELSNGDLSQTEFDSARQELESHLVHDVTATRALAGSAAGKPAWATLIAIVILLPLISFVLYAQLGQPELVATPVVNKPAPPSSSQQAETAAHSIADMVDGLALKLQQHPDDGAGWAMLGRSYIFLERPAEAALAFAKAYQLLGEQPQLLADYAEALALVNHDALDGQPLRLARRSLELDPDNQKALWLTGVAAMQRGDSAEAARYWQRLAALLPPGSQQAQTLQQHIAKAAGAVAPTAAKPVDEQSSAASLRVSVNLDAALAANADPNASVFIFARAAQGPRMPLAIARRQANELPLTVMLDDSMAMAPNFKLSLFPQVIVGARLSRSGDAMAQSGDLEGYSQPLRVSDSTEAQIIINQIVP